MPDLFVGLMSGTSMDAVDAALVHLSGNLPVLVARTSIPVPDTLRRKLQELSHGGGANELERLTRADVQIDFLWTRQGIAYNRWNPGFHHLHYQPRANSTALPVRPCPFYTQIGDPNLIAEHTEL